MAYTPSEQLAISAAFARFDGCSKGYVSLTLEPKANWGWGGSIGYGYLVGSFTFWKTVDFPLDPQQAIPFSRVVAATKVGIIIWVRRFTSWTPKNGLIRSSPCGFPVKPPTKRGTLKRVWCELGTRTLWGIPHEISRCWTSFRSNHFFRGSPTSRPLSWTSFRSNHRAYP